MLNAHPSQASLAGSQNAGGSQKRIQLASTQNQSQLSINRNIAHTRQVGIPTLNLVEGMPSEEMVQQL